VEIPDNWIGELLSDSDHGPEKFADWLEGHGDVLGADWVRIEFANKDRRKAFYECAEEALRGALSGDGASDPSYIVCLLSALLNAATETWQVRMARQFNPLQPRQSRTFGPADREALATLIIERRLPLDDEALATLIDHNQRALSDQMQRNPGYLRLSQAPQPPAPASGSPPES
jgi:hypothetical protein